MVIGLELDMELTQWSFCFTNYCYCMYVYMYVCMYVCMYVLSLLLNLQCCYIK